MTQNELFKGFLQNVHEEDPVLVEAIEKGFSLIFESKKKEPAYRKKPSPVFDSKSPYVTDNKDHFPLGSEAQARNALARVNQYHAVPKWYKGKSLESMKAKVADEVKKHFPGIKVTQKSYK